MNEHEDPSGSQEELKKIVEEQESEAEQPMEDGAREDMDTERIIKEHKDRDRASHPDDKTDPVE